MKNKLLVVFVIIFLGLFLLSILEFISVRLLYNFEHGIYLFEINFMDYFLDGFIERLKLIFLYVFILFIPIVIWVKRDGF